ncbi:MAG: helix-hairpin-helix domain-containing protein, partial [Burkholderiales bacterium]|nr:helix-hairpin-helix domain-containing protein [Burkholderiales bacterium]
AIGTKPGDKWLAEVIGWTWRVKLSMSLSLDLMREMRERAEEEAIRVFARNLKDLLLAAPAGTRATMGLDPGIRTGVKVAVIDNTGKVLETTTVYPFPPKNDVRGTQAELASLVRKHKVELIAIGNGTGSRETEKLVADMLAQLPAPKPTKVIVSEAGASVYSASETAAAEFPNLDVSLRGAVSIARRLQDPLAELVKIEPKSIGVGQYQHDVNQTRLARSLDAVVEDCVNAVGVDVNTASVALLAHISGLSSALAENIVRHRDEHGPFADREGLKSVPRMGSKTFEQAAGFLRIVHGDNPLDASAVHPEAYPVVERILDDIRRSLPEVMGNAEVLKGLELQRYTDERFGLPTVQDIVRELEKPGRDPRPQFKTAAFKEGVEGLKDLQPGMQLEGVVTNVTNFGAFVDVGVHQDGLVHISALSHRFVKDPRDVVKAGDVVKVKVLEVDEKRKRIALSMRLDEAPQAGRRPGAGAGTRASTGTVPTPSSGSRRVAAPSDRRPGAVRPGAPLSGGWGPGSPDQRSGEAGAAQPSSEGRRARSSDRRPDAAGRTGPSSGSRRATSSDRRPGAGRGPGTFDQRTGEGGRDRGRPAPTGGKPAREAPMTGALAEALARALKRNAG